jgi:hypothetical protein
MTTSPPDFTRYIGTSYERFILPVLPFGAVLKMRMDGTTLDPSNCGKIPGKLLAHGNGRGQPAWIGFQDWSTHVTTKFDLELWQRWHTPTLPVPICMRLPEHPAGDCDINREDDRDEVVGIFQEVCGVGPMRTRPNSPRVTLLFKWEAGTPPVTSRSMNWTDDKDAGHGVDFLGVGRHTVIEGRHKSGVDHEWWGGFGDLLACEGQLPLVNAGKFSGVHAGIRALIERKGYNLKKGPALVSFDGSDLATHKIGDPDILSPLAVKPGQLDMLKRCVMGINLDHPEIDYDTFITLLRAIKASCNGDHAFFTDVVWEWTRTQKEARGAGPRTGERGIEWLEERWNSFRDSGVGADFVFKWAAASGYRDEEIEALQDNQRATRAQELFGGPTNDEREAAEADHGDAARDAEGGDGGGVAAMLPPGQVGGGPTAFPWTDRACADRFAATHPNWRHAEDDGWVRLDSGVYVPDPGVIHPISDMCSAIGDPYRAQGAQGAKIDQMMKSTHKAEAVERMARRHPTLVARKEDFDADPWMLNTPDFIIDLRNGDTYPHGALMRNQTLVTPQLAAWDLYEAFCPRWLAFLHQICEDEQDIALLARHGGNGLVGTPLDQLLLFIHGQGGTGKSAFSDILHRVAGTYSKVGSSAMFQKQADKRNYELGGTVGKRSLFVPETLKGMTWDEV